MQKKKHTFSLVDQRLKQVTLVEPLAVNAQKIGPIKYECSWIGIDSGREGLWKEPIWKSVLQIIAEHEGESVYDETSPIYQSLEQAHPAEAWRSYTKEGQFRPLFRDYPNAWTRTGVITLHNKKFQLTEMGRQILTGNISKSNLLIEMFRQHVELTGPNEEKEKPFAIIASGLLAATHPLSTNEIYWAIMKNYRPLKDDLTEVLKKKIRLIHKKPESTPYRRLRNMLSLMRTAGVIESSRRGAITVWSPLDKKLLNDMAA